MVQRRDEAAKAKASDHPHYRAIAQYTYDWESWIGPRGKVRWINPAVERITGYSVRECMQMSDYPLRMVVPGDRSRIAEALHSAARGSVGNDLEFRVLRKDGALRWVAMSWQSILERGRRRGYRTSIRDIDQRKAFEQALHEARHQAERAVRSKAEFLANVSHELRSPAQCIRGFAELMALSQLDESQRRYLRFRRPGRPAPHPRGTAPCCQGARAKPRALGRGELALGAARRPTALSAGDGQSPRQRAQVHRARTHLGGRPSRKRRDLARRLCRCRRPSRRR